MNILLNKLLDVYLFKLETNFVVTFQLQKIQSSEYSSLEEMLTRFLNNEKPPVVETTQSSSEHSDGKGLDDSLKSEDLDDVDNNIKKESEAVGSMEAEVNLAVGQTKTKWKEVKEKVKIHIIRLCTIVFNQCKGEVTQV